MKIAKVLKSAFAVAIVLVMLVAMVPAVSAAENFVELTVDSLGLDSQKYVSTSATAEDANDIELTAPVAVGGVSFDFIQIGNYGSGMQMRDKEGKTSKLWNATAFAGGITKIELTINAGKQAYDNADCMILTFGDTAKGATYSTTLSTTKGNKNYTITPDADTYTFFYLEWNLGFSSYWDSIKVYYNEATQNPPASSTPASSEPASSTPASSTPASSENASSTPAPKPTGDNTNIIGMTIVMVLAVTAVAALVIGNKKRSV